MPAELRLGIIGYDTSHVPTFTRLLNVLADPHHVRGARVVAGYPSFSPDIEASASRVEGFRAEMSERYGIPEVDSIEELVDRVDAVLLESVDGRRHLAEIRPVLDAGLPVYVDKPLAANYADAAEIVRLAEERGCPLFSASSLRYDAHIAALRDDETLGEVIGCDAFSPCSLEPTNPGLFWYGVHGVEILYTFMGPGCTAVQAHVTPGTHLVVGRWGDERLGAVRGLRRGAADYGATVVGAERIASVHYSREVPIYAQLLREIVPFFRGERVPVPPEETLEMMAFMQAALLSEREEREVALAEVTGG